MPTSIGDKMSKLILVFGGIALGFGIGELLVKPLLIEEPKQPTIKCTDGKLYDVSYEDNITILEKRPFTTCEER